jgi:hypothetical protein
MWPGVKENPTGTGVGVGLGPGVEVGEAVGIGVSRAVGVGTGVTGVVVVSDEVLHAAPAVMNAATATSFKSL